MVQLSFTLRRVIIGVALVIAAFSLANYLLDWRLFGGLDRKVMIACYTVLAVVMLKWLPSHDEWAEYRRRKGGAE